MRHTLEQLKAMSDDELHASWLNADFPFDRATCKGCLLCHQESWACADSTHRELIKSMNDMPTIYPFGSGLRSHLEELYALRLFYDHLYPQEAQAEKQFARIEEEVWDSRANTR